MVALRPDTMTILIGEEIMMTILTGVEMTILTGEEIMMMIFIIRMIMTTIMIAMDTIHVETVVLMSRVNKG